MRRAVLSLTCWLPSPRCRFAQETFKGPELFPLGNFNTWTYRVQGQDDRDRLSVTSILVSEKSGDRVYRFEARLRNQTIASEHLAVRKDGLYRLRHDNVDLEPPLLICRFPPVKGQKWKGEYKINDKKIAVNFECDVEDLAVNWESPTDKKNRRPSKLTVLVVRAEINDGDVTLKNTCWYAANTGLVKQVVEEGESKIILDLESYVISKGKGPFKMPNP